MSYSHQTGARRKRRPNAWLGAGVLGAGVCWAALAGSGVAAADSAAAGATSASASPGSVSAGVSRAARGSGAATARRQSGSASSPAPARSVVVAARSAAVVNPASAQPPSLPDSAIPAPTVAGGQAQIADSFNDAPKVTASSVATVSASAQRPGSGRSLPTPNPPVTDVPPPTANPSKGAATTKVSNVPRAFASAGVRVGTDANFAAAVLNSNKPVMVDFTATWCGPCKRLAPNVEQVADEYAGRAIVVKVDIDDNPVITAQYDIRSVPTILIFSGGVVVERFVGMTSKANLIGLIAKYL